MMPPDWFRFIHPLVLYGILTLSAISLLYAWVVNAKLRTFVRESRARREELEGRLRRITEEAAVQNAPQEAAARLCLPGRSLHLNQRGQALRMRNRGEKPETISAALGIPRNEVDLMFKVQQLAREAMENQAAG